jgi:hypothetical protein
MGTCTEYISDLSCKSYIETFYTMTQEITLKAATELIKAAASSLQKDILKELKAFAAGSKIICYNSDTELPELAVGEAVVLVKGNLNIQGMISDCKDVDASLLIVLGNVTCKNLITLSAMYITGDLKVAHTMLADSLNDYTCKIGGNLEVRTIIEGGHWIEIKGKATFQYLYSHCEPKDKNGELKPNLADAELMNEIEENPDDFQGHYYKMIKEVQDGGNYDMRKSIKYITKGGEWFCEQ